MTSRLLCCSFLCEISFPELEGDVWDAFLTSRAPPPLVCMRCTQTWWPAFWGPPAPSPPATLIWIFFLPLYCLNQSFSVLIPLQSISSAVWDLVLEGNQTSLRVRSPSWGFLPSLTMGVGKTPPRFSHSSLIVPPCFPLNTCWLFGGFLPPQTAPCFPLLATDGMPKAGGQARSSLGVRVGETPGHLITYRWLLGVELLHSYYFGVHGDTVAI